MPTPHYLRFARALALLGGLTGCGASAAEPAPSTEQGASNDTTGDEHVTPGGTGTVASTGLNGCACSGVPIEPSECAGISDCASCCASREPMRGMVGPLSPPDLPA